jgi:hypothetical protein
VEELFLQGSELTIIEELDFFVLVISCFYGNRNDRLAQGGWSLSDRNVAGKKEERD